jgi:hypothetical protein
MPWTPDEDHLLLHHLGIFGHKWSALAAFFPGRESNAVRNRCRKLARQQEAARPQFAQGVLRADVVDAAQLDDDDSPARNLPSCASLMKSIAGASDITKLYPLML